MTQESSPLPAASSTPWPRWMVIMMTIGYAGYYLCRSHFSVAKPLMIDELKGSGINKESLGIIAAWGTMFYAAGKFLFGSLSDLFGGRRMFLLGMGGAILFSILFGIGGPPIFLMAWVGNRFIQASGWVGMVKMTSRWFSHSTYGRVMGFISLSFLFGDFLSRLFLSSLVSAGVDWRGLFYISAAVLAVIFVPTYIIFGTVRATEGCPRFRKIRTRCLRARRRRRASPPCFCRSFHGPRFGSFAFCRLGSLSCGRRSTIGRRRIFTKPPDSQPTPPVEQVRSSRSLADLV